MSPCRFAVAFVYTTQAVQKNVPTLRIALKPPVLCVKFGTFYRRRVLFDACYLLFGTVRVYTYILAVEATSCLARSVYTLTYLQSKRSEAHVSLTYTHIGHPHPPPLP